MPRITTQPTLGFTLMFPALISLFLLPSARADDWTAKVRPAAGGSPIAGLAISTDPIPVKVDERGQAPVILTTLQGTYSQAQAGWSLSTASEELAATKGSGTATEIPLKLRVILTGQETSVELVAVGPSGDVQKQSFTLVVDNWDDLTTSVRHSVASRSHFTVGVGVESLSLKDSRFPDTSSEIALGVRGAWNKPLAGTQWSLMANLSLTAAPITTSSSVGFDYRLLVASAGIGYQVPQLVTPWSLVLAPGYFYRTILTSASKGGYRNLSGPVAQVSAVRELSDNRAAALTAGFSMIGPASLSDNFISLDAEYRFGLLDRPFSAGLEFSTLSDTISSVTLSETVFALVARIGL